LEILLLLITTERLAWEYNFAHFCP